MPPNPDPSGRGPSGTELIPGRRAVLEVLRAGRPLRKILIGRHVRHAGTVQEILQEARRKDVVVQFVDANRLDAMAPTAHHQGIVAMVAAKAVVTVDEILTAARVRGEPPFVVVLDGVEDPANLGAIIRTAEGAGAHGVIIPKHRAAGLSPAVAKSSAGALEYLSVAQVTNLTRTLEDLKAAGLWVVGADPLAKDHHFQARLLPPLVIVMGSEGRGLSRLVREHCDFLVRLPMRGEIASLNVAVAAGVLLYEVVRQQEAAKREGT